MSRQDVPQDVPNWTTIRYYFDKWTHDGTGQRIHDRLREQGRRQAGRATEPTAAIIDSQSVKTTEAGGDRGYDGGKKVTGRKRHILVDTSGELLVVVVHSAALQDRDGAELVFAEAAARYPTLYPTLRKVWSDGSYRGQLSRAAIAGSYRGQLSRRPRGSGSARL